MSVDLLSIQNWIEVPFISASLGGYTFGVYQRNSKVTSQGLKTIVDYPNLVKSLRIQRNASGTVNIYTLELTYAITEFDDPNMLEKIFSKATKDRKIVFNYGDYSSPTYIYKQEQALIQKIVPRFNFSSHTINYTLTAISSVINKGAAVYNFPKRVAKPSDVIQELIWNKNYYLADILFGMLDKERILQDGLILRDDRKITLEAQSMTILSYLNYLVDNMISETDSVSGLKNSIYRLAFFDDITSIYNGPYFKITKQTSNIITNKTNLITFDIGYAEKSSVIDFSADVSELWSILYNYNGEIKQSQIQYIIDDNGLIVTEDSNRLFTSSTLHKISEEEKNWISKMTSFPIKGTLTIKGLIKPAILCTNIKLNILFYGKPYILSGTYMIIGQDDTIDQSGYKTVLSLVRVGGDIW